MSSVPAVVVRKGGFLSALAHGFFTFLTVGVVAAAGFGAYAMWLADVNLARLTTLGSTALESLPQWQAALPPALADAVHDRRDPDYRSNLRVSAKLVRGRGEREGRAVVEVENRGPLAVSLLALRVALEDRESAPQEEFIAYVASPLAIDGSQWRGPLMPGDRRRVARRVQVAGDDLAPSVEVCELRVWTPPAAQP